MYREYLDCCSLTQIADRLNIEQVPTKHATKWDKATIYGILTNPIYTGYSLWDEILQKGKHVQIIDVPSFEQVQELLARKARRAGSSPRHSISAIPQVTAIKV
jgi:hypothetical protein